MRKLTLLKHSHQDAPEDCQEHHESVMRQLGETKHCLATLKDLVKTFNEKDTLCANSEGSSRKTPYSMMPVHQQK